MGKTCCFSETLSWHNNTQEAYDLKPLILSLVILKEIYWSLKSVRRQINSFCCFFIGQTLSCKQSILMLDVILNAILIIYILTKIVIACNVLDFVAKNATFKKIYKYYIWILHSNFGIYNVKGPTSQKNKLLQGNEPWGWFCKASTSWKVNNNPCTVLWYTILIVHVCT